MTSQLTQMDDEALADYFAFVLDLYDRFGREGVKVMELFAPKARKPMRPILHAAASKAPGRGGLIAEFGVHKGHSIRELAQAFPARIIHGFDSFEGFPDDGRADWDQDFSVPELPEVPETVTLHQGFFEATLPPFAAALEDEKVADLLHIDCDIYSSAREVFLHLGERITAGTVLLFDELVNYDEFLSNEMLAFYEWTRKTGLGASWLASKGRLRPLKDYKTRLEGGFAGYRQKGWYQNAALVVTDDADRDAREHGFQDEASRLLAAFREGSSPLDW